MCSIRQHYDPLATDDYTGNASGARVLTPFIPPLQHIVTSRPYSHSHSLDCAAEMVTAAGTTASDVVGMIGTEAGLRAKCSDKTAVLPTSLSLSEPSSPIPSHSIDRLDKTDAPPIPELFIYPLGVQIPRLALDDGLAGYAIPIYNFLATHRIARARARTRPAPPINATRIQARPLGPADSARDTKCQLAHAARCSHLPSHHQPFQLPIWRCPPCAAHAARRIPPCARKSRPPATCLRCSQRTTTSAGGAALPRLTGITLGLAGSDGDSESGSGAGLSQRNLACLYALIADAMFLAGTPGPGWFTVLETLQNAYYVLTTRGTAPPSSAAFGSQHWCNFWCVKRAWWCAS